MARPMGSYRNRPSSVRGKSLNETSEARDQFDKRSRPWTLTRTGGGFFALGALMDKHSGLPQMWSDLPPGARAALTEQWAGLAAGGLPCGSAIVDAHGHIIASGRNHSYDPAGAIETRMRYALQHNRLAHAELNALARIPTEVDHSTLTLWSTQHPCSMCAAAVAFVGIGNVHFVADDPSDHSPTDRIFATRAGVPYQPLRDPLWWTVSNVLFLYNSAAREGEHATNIATNRSRLPAIVDVTLDLARHDVLGPPARSGIGLPDALAPHLAALTRVAGMTRVTGA